MKNLLSLSPSKIFIVCGLGLAMTLGSFWHHQVNQTQLDRMSVLNQGVGTCFNRISQTFTAMMIRDIQSPYLHQGFMALSDECLNETIKGINPFRQNVGKGYETLNKLISDVHWFHESVVKIHTPMVAGLKLDAPLAPLSEKYGKMETFKTGLVDAIEDNSAKLRQIQTSDELLMGAGLIIFVLALSVLSLQEFNRMQLSREIEKQALNLLKSGQANVGAIVDQLVDRALTTQHMPVTAQIFKDYHGDVLERMAVRIQEESNDTTGSENKNERPYEVPRTDTSVVESSAPEHKSSLKEVLVSLESMHSKQVLQLSDVRDVQLNVELESLEQMLNAAVSKLASRRTENKKILVTNQIHTDRTIVSLFLAGNTFTASELEFGGVDDKAIEGIDTNLVILKEMVLSAGASWHLENKTDRQGKITGMNIRFVLNRATRESRTKNLVSVLKGKKKDLTREMMN